MDKTNSNDKNDCEKWQDLYKKAANHCNKYLKDITYLRGVIRDCLIFAGCKPSSPRAERRIHGIDFVTSILDALQSAYGATSQYSDTDKQQIESVIREKIREAMEDTDDRD